MNKFKVGDMVVSNSSTGWGYTHKGQVTKIGPLGLIYIKFKHVHVDISIPYDYSYFELDQESINEQKIKKLLGVGDGT